MADVSRFAPPGPALSLRLTLYVIAISMTWGCTVGPDFERPVPPADDRYTHEPAISATVVAGGESQRFIPGAAPPENWWQLFGSPELDDTVQTAFSHNPTADAAQASLRESQDNLRAGYGVFFPQVGVAGQAMRELAPPANGQLQQAGVFNLTTASASVTYLFDFFGGKRRSVEALRAQVDYQRYLAIATYLTLSTNVVNTTIAYAAYRAELDATQHVISLQMQQLDAIRAQVSAGTASFSSILSIQSLIASNQATVSQLDQKLAQSSHLLATLQGRPPAQAAPPTVTLEALTLPADLPVTLPSQLVRQRPDVLAAEARLHVASANIGVATAAMFPSISLSGTYGKQANAFAQLPADGFRFWGIGPSVSIPIFEGGSLRYARQAAIDAFEVAQASYRQTVLTAFAQVADALSSLEQDAKTLQAEEAAMQDAREALDLVQVNLRAGTAGYLDVLVADVQYQQSSIAYLDAVARRPSPVARRQQDTVALLAALGGGWRALPGIDGDGK